MKVDPLSCRLIIKLIKEVRKHKGKRLQMAASSYRFKRQFEDCPDVKLTGVYDVAWLWLEFNEHQQPALVYDLLGVTRGRPI